MASMMLFVEILILLAVPSGVASDTVHFYRHDGQVFYPDVQYEDGQWTLHREDAKPSVMVSNRIIARFGSDLDPHAGALDGFDLKMVSEIHAAHTIWVFEATGPIQALEACAQLVERGVALWAVPDYEIPVGLAFLPDDPFYPDQWHLGGSGSQSIGAEDAWDMSTGNGRVVIAILDTGVDMAHPDLDPDRMVTGYDAVHDDDDPYPSDKAIDHHGTACAGLAAASMNNSVGVSGVCPHCSWMPVRVFDDGGYMALSALSRGMTWAVDHGAWVLSNSWVVSQSLIDAGVDIEPVREAVRYAVNSGREGRGCVVLFAAGNGDSELNAQPIGPDELQSMDEVMTVGGCDQNGVVAKYSNYGPSVSVVAPTWSGYPQDPYITTTDTSGDAGTNRGGVHYTTDPGGQDVATSRVEPDVQGDYTAFFSGTSASCPIAAGLVGLVFSVSPELGWKDLKLLLEDTAQKVGQDAESPRVAAEYDDDGFDPHYGYGRVDAAHALVRAMYGLLQADGKPCRLDENCLNSCVFEQDAAKEGICARICMDEGQCDADQECLGGICLARKSREISGGCSCSVARGFDDKDLESLWWLVIMILGNCFFRKCKLRF